MTTTNTTTRNKISTAVSFLYLSICTHTQKNESELTNLFIYHPKPTEEKKNKHK